MVPCGRGPNNGVLTDGVAGALSALLTDGGARCESSPRMPTVTTAELARRVGCSPKFIRDEIAAGQIKAIRIGHKNRIGSRLLISKAEANRYCRALGVSDDTLPPAITALWTIVATTPTAACVIKDSVIVSANYALVELSGYSLKELIGARASSLAAGLEFTIPPFVASHADSVAMRHKTGAIIDTLITRLPVLADGAHYVLSLTTPIDRCSAQSRCRKRGPA